jgi:nicotinamide-nucleotide amidase
MGESHIDHRLAGLLPGPDKQQERREKQQIAIHYRTSAPENHVKVVIRGADAAHNARTLQGLEGEIRGRLGAVIYGVDGDSLPEVLARTLIGAGATLALAESCTGGYAGQLVTSQPGASRFFLGGVLAYSDEIKRALLGVRPETLAAHGAVSEPCAAEMAEGVRQRCQATLGVSITGIAGSSQEGPLTPDRAPDSESIAKPVGTVCFGVSGPRGATTVTQHFFGGRERIRRAAAYFALDLSRRHFDSAI